MPRNFRPIALATYGAGLPAFALVRIFASTFYARHDTMTPARVTVTAIVANIALKMVFVWGHASRRCGHCAGHLVGRLGECRPCSLGREEPARFAAASERRFRARSLRSRFLAASPPWRARALRRTRAASVVQGGLRHRGLLMAIVCAGNRYGAMVLVFRNRLPSGV